MRQRFFDNSQRKLMTRLLLVILLFRAYVPVGFMPASGAPFLLQICPAAITAQMPAHYAHHHSGSHVEFADCPFGSAPAAGPLHHYVFEIFALDTKVDIAANAADPFDTRAKMLSAMQGHVMGKAVYMGLFHRPE